MSSQPTQIIQLYDVHEQPRGVLGTVAETIRTRGYIKNIQDALIVLLPLLMLGFSLLMLYSTTGVMAEEKFSDALFFVKRQAFAALLGGAALVGISFCSLRFLQKISSYAFFVSVFLLLLLFIPGIAETAGGATRWANIFGFRFQPAEFVKLSYILFISGYFARHADKMKRFSYGIVKPFLCVGVLAGLLLMQPDFGSSAVIACITLCLVLCLGVRLAHVLTCGVVLSTLMGILVAISPYRMKRFLAFLDPFQDKSGSGYQLIQSLIAVGSGKVSGLGLGSSQQKLFYLPAAHTDFIYAVIAEELGFLGALAVLLSFLFFMFLGFSLAKRLMFDTFAYSLAIGLTLLIAMPAFINVGVVTGMLPTKGLVLPLIGYGGTCVLISLAAVGMLLSLVKYARKHERLHG